MKQPIIRRHNEPVVVVRYSSSDASIHALVEKGHEMGWRLLSLDFTRGSIPSDVNPVGAILYGFPSDPLAARIKEFGCPVVFIAPSCFDEELRVPFVYEDQVMAGRMAAEHFVNRGFRSVGYIRYTPQAPAPDLYASFAQRSEELGCMCHALGLENSGPPHETTQAKTARQSKIIGEWLSSVPKPLGLLAFTDTLAGRFSIVCQSYGLSVPEEVAILGMGNHVGNCELAPFPLSSIDMNKEQLARKAVQLLGQLIQGTAAPDTRVAIRPTRVVERYSTNVLAVSDERVARAIRYLWDHLDQPLTAEDVARETGVPVGTLRGLFKKYLGRSMNAELRRKRLDYCCELLRSTTMPVADIAKTVGLKSKSYLYQAFQKEFGRPLRDYRLHHNRD